MADRRRRRRCADPGRPRRRARGRARQRPRRRLPARAVDDLHARRQRGAARPDGRAHRRLRAADRGHAADAASWPTGRVARHARCRCWSGPCCRLAMVFLLQRTPLGRYVYAIGNRERAAYLSGINTRVVLVAAFAICGAVLGARPACCSPATRPRPTRAWATPTCCRRSPPWCIGGTNILGGRGRYLGTVVGAILITLLSSRALGHADARGRPPGHLRRGHHRHAAGLRAQPEGRRLSPPVTPPAGRSAPAAWRPAPRR